jgi:hypothetical protein
LLHREQLLVGPKLMRLFTTFSRARAGTATGDIEWLRCPGEGAELGACIAANVFIIAIAFNIVVVGSDWLDGHPFVAKHIDSIRALALAGIVALPVLPLSRHVSIHVARDGGVRVGESQFPELYAQLLRACRKLDVSPIPELYISRHIATPSAVYSVEWRNSVVVLNADLFDKSWREGIDWLSFVLAGAIGALRLGHTRWWVELLTGYAGRIPGLRRPLLLKRTYSRDRCAAYVVPEGIRGLLVEAVGKDAVRSVAISDFVKQSKDTLGVWDALGALLQKTPPLTDRARALYDAGLFDERRDLAT